MKKMKMMMKKRKNGNIVVFHCIIANLMKTDLLIEILREAKVKIRKTI